MTRPSSLSRRTFLAATATLPTLSRVGSAAHHIKHSFLMCGAVTQIVGEDGNPTWSNDLNTRDGWALPGGEFLLAVTRKKGVHGGRAIKVSKSGEELLSFAGTQDEINTVQPLSGGGVLLTEAGKSPRIVELDAKGKVRFELPLDCQTENTHLQSRMTRKLANGNYLVPQMGEKEVREYTPQGKIVWRASTPHWPFTAIRLADGNSLVTCTMGHQVIEFDENGKAVWKLTNDDLDGNPLDDCCGAQRLPNGNTVVTSYHAKAGAIKLTEVNRAKEVVWSYRDEQPSGIHHFQVLTTNGEALDSPALK